MARETLILTGFMGVGKSTAGRRTAEFLEVPYSDTDDWMETNSGVNVPELVKTDMARFRELEAQTLGIILAENPGIISTGGGIVSTEVGRSALLGASVPVLWLRAPFEVSQERVLHDTGRERPLFNDIDTARSLYEQRMDWYQETAGHIIDATEPIDYVVEQIVTIAQA